MKYIILIVFTALMMGCSVYGNLSKCDNYDERGSACMPVTESRKYAITKENEEVINDVPILTTLEHGNSAISCDNSSCIVNIDYKLLDKQVKKDEFARLVIERKAGMSETDPVLKPAKVIKATILPYSDGRKFYQLRHIWIKTESEEWILGKSVVIDAKRTTIMDSDAQINYETDKIIVNQLNSGDKKEVNKQNLDTSPKNLSEKGTGDNSPVPDKTLNTGDTATINVFFLNVRKEASHKSSIVGVIPAGGRVTVLEDKSNKWQKVSVVYYPNNSLLKSYDGWVHSDYLVSVDSIENWTDGL